MSELIIHHVAPLIVIAIFIFAVTYHICTALLSGSVSFGYKYYSPTYICEKKKEPAVFWFVIGIYTLSLIACISLGAFIAIQIIG